MQQEAGATINTEQVVGNEERRGRVGPQDQWNVGNAKTTVSNQDTRQTMTGAKRLYRKLSPTIQDSYLPLFWRRVSSFHFQNDRSKRFHSRSKRERAESSPSEACKRERATREMIGGSGERERLLRESKAQESVNFGSS